MKIILLLLIHIALLGQSKNNELQAIRSVMAAQQEAWNRADLEAFMAGYWNSDSLQFIGRNGITYGWHTTLENYKKGYPDAQAMGKLTFTIISLELVSQDAAHMIGRYHLKRTTDELQGIFSLLWRKIDRKWVIVADHTG